jgi:hypothetical protein
MANEQKKTPAQEVIWRAEDDQALATLSPEQLKIARRRFEVSQEALRDFDQKHAAKSQRDEERRIANLSTKDLEALCRQGDEDARRRNG